MPASGKVISVLNMKGGVGKTTISAHVIRVLYLLKRKKVLLLDLDPQFNLTQAVMSRAEYDKFKAAGRTVFAAMEPHSTLGLFDVATTPQPPPKPSTLAKVLRRSGNDAYLHLVPGNFELVKYSLITDHPKLAAVQQRFLQFIGLARSEYDLIVIDCNPSSSFITLCALHACSYLLVPVRPDRYSILGLELVADFLERIPTIYPKPEISVLLNGIPRTGYDSRTEDELRAHTVFGNRVLTNKLHHSLLLAATSSYTGFATDKPVPHKNRLRKEITAIVTELATLWGI